jgi:hypothetical protein
MNKAFLGTMINASGPEKNLTLLYQCPKKLLHTIKMKYDQFLCYVCSLCVGEGRVLELGSSVLPFGIAVLRQIHMTLSAFISQRQIIIIIKITRKFLNNFSYCLKFLN